MAALGGLPRLSSLRVAMAFFANRKDRDGLSAGFSAERTKAYEGVRNAANSDAFILRVTRESAFADERFFVQMPMQTCESKR